MATNWSEILYLALASQLGIVISVTDANAAKQSLYQTRSKLSDPSLGCLQFRTSPDNPAGEIWIIKARVNATQG